MKITIYYGSIHKERGNTYVIINEFAEGAKKAGAEVDIVLLAEKKINNCVACLKCWTKTPGKCVLKDDMPDLLEQFMASDLVVLATPVYNYNVTGIMKTFLDRTTPIVDPRMVKLENGRTGHFKRYDKYPEFGVIATGGFPEQSCCDFISSYFNQVAGELFSRVIFEIYKGQGIFLKMGEKTPIGPLVDEYRQTIQTAAAEVVGTKKISEETAQKLNQPFIPEEMYIEEANKYWESRIPGGDGK